MPRPRRSRASTPTPKSDPEIEAELKRNFQLAGQLGATGTPLFVIGDRVMNGAVGYDALKQAIAGGAEEKSRAEPPLNPWATTYHSLESLRLAGGLACFTVVKFRLSSATSALSAPPGKDLGDISAAGLQHLARKLQARLDQRHGAQMIGLLVADGVGGHVRQNEVGRTAERLPEPVGRAFVHEVHLQDGDAIDRVGRQEVDADYRRLRRLAANHLAPAARRNAKVDDRLHALEQPEALVELEQLVRGAAAIILGPGALDVGVVELAFEPARRRNFAALGGLEPLHNCQPSRAINERRMPSRMPRSATPRFLAGQISMIASRIAQPATTRSARSLPMHGRLERSS